MPACLLLGIHCQHSFKHPSPCITSACPPALACAVFSFVRNPWARAMSSWHHIHKYGLHPPCQDSFTKFAQLPSAYGAKCLAQRSCCKRRFGWLLEHLEPQTTCLFDERGRPAVDFLGRVEHLDADMQVVWRLSSGDNFSILQ